MELQPVSYKTANLAVKKGFNDIVGKWRGKHYYNHKGELDGDVLEEIKERLELKKKHGSFEEGDKHRTLFSIPAPSHTLLQKWLLENHYIHVYATTDWCTWSCTIERPDHEPIHLQTFISIEDALEEGLSQALQLI